MTTLYIHSLPSPRTRRAFRRPLGALLLACSLACGAAEEPTSSSEQTSSPAPVPDVQEAPTGLAPPSYEVHEWGLIDVHGDRYELAAGAGDPTPAPAANAPAGMTPAPMRPPVMQPMRPTAPRPPIGRRKPVLYVHLTSGEPITFTAQVTGAGRIVEHWPPAELSEGGVRWSNVVASAGTDACSGLTYPTRESDACRDPDGGYCELADLPGYEANDGACLTYQGQPWDHLFYRGSGEGPTLPVQIARDAQNVTITSPGVTNIGRAFYVRRGAAGEPVVASAHAVTRGGDTVIDTTAANTSGLNSSRTELAGLLRSGGLTDAEAQAFERAWFGELFEAGDTGGAPLVREAILYMLPSADVAPFSTLTLTPTPASVRRVFWVRVDVTPGSAG